MYIETLIHVGACLMGFVLSMLIIPGIIQIAVSRNLFDVVNNRKIHISNIPPFGGVAIFTGMLISTLIFSEFYFQPGIYSVIAAGSIMLLTGIKDDLLNIGAKEKLIYQAIAASVLIFSPGNLLITHLHQLAGLAEIHKITGILITTLLVLTIVNAYNLIDGIDGLASLLAITGTVFFGIWFFISGYYGYSILSFAMAGSLAGFFLFNVFGVKYKLFMGDTGSLLTGLVVAALIIAFNELNALPSVPAKIRNAPVVSLAVVIIPLTDMLRVMTIRIMKGNSPFSGDKNHIHHILLHFFPSHLIVSLILTGITLVYIGVALWLNLTGINILIQFIALLASTFLIFSLLTYMVNVKEKKNQESANPVSEILHKPASVYSLHQNQK